MVVIQMMLILIALMVIVFVWKRIMYIRLLKRYGQRFEHIYVVHRHLLTGEEISIREDFMEMVVHCDQYDVMKVVRQQEKLLRLANNPFFENDKVPETQRLKVLPFFYQDEDFVNEDWIEFQERIVWEIKESRRGRHKSLSNTDRNWYLQNKHNQTYEWVKQ